MARAHLVSTPFGDFYGGMLHPVTALEHLLPWPGVGLLAGFQEPTRGRWMLLAFPIGLLVGLGLAQWAPLVVSLSSVNVASFIVLGVLVALAWPLPLWVLTGLGLAFGVSHGHENGLAMSQQTNASLFLAGVAAAGYVVVTLMAALVSCLSQKRHGFRVAVRAAGSWIGAIGIMMAGLGCVDIY
jgi:urease accessory protein